MTDSHISPPTALRTNAARVMERLLKQPAWIVQALRTGAWREVMPAMTGLALGGLVLYGLTVGMFSWGAQLWAAPLKIAAGMALAALICYPSLVVFGWLAGSDAAPRELAGALLGTVCLAALLLSGLSPVAWIFSQSTASPVFMGGLHLVFLGIALWYGLRFFKTALALLGARQARPLAAWGVIFILVLLQMTATLRPLIGSSERLIQTEKKFFLAYWVECCAGADEPSPGAGRAPRH